MTLYPFEVFSAFQYFNDFEGSVYISFVFDFNLVTRDSELVVLRLFEFLLHFDLLTILRVLSTCIYNFVT